MYPCRIRVEETTVLLTREIGKECEVGKNNLSSLQRRRKEKKVVVDTGKEKCMHRREKWLKGRKLVSVENSVCSKPCGKHFMFYIYRSVEAAILSP